MISSTQLKQISKNINKTVPNEPKKVGSVVSRPLQKGLKAVSSKELL